jgi:DNA repair exonuclease SbcCD ATPase subunit
MEKNMSEDIDSSFELFEPIIETMPTTQSMPNSMSIVTISDESKHSAIDDMNDRILSDMSNALQLSQNIENSINDNNDNNLVTTTIQSFADNFQSDRQIEEQELLTEQLSHLEKQLNTSLKTLSNSNSLAQIDSNTDLSNDSFSNDLENYLKELRDENEKLKSALEKNNYLMKQQLKNLQDWQMKNNQTIDEHKRMSDESKAIIEQLRLENNRLKDQVSQGMASFKSVEELTAELASLRSKCDQLNSYEKLDVISELQTQNLTKELVDAKQTINSLSLETNSLKNELNEANERLRSVPIMKSQLEIYERDFKVEEMAKLAALKEVDALEKEIEKLKKNKEEMEEKLEKGAPVLDLKTEPTVGKTHHRRNRHGMGKLGRSPIPALSVGAVLRGIYIVIIQ